MNDIISIKGEFNLGELKLAIQEAEKLEDNERFFEALTAIYKVKRQIGELDDAIASIESAAKSLISDRARAEYGADWSAIKGEHFKITRSKTGDVYAIVGEPNKKFLKIKTSVDSKIVDVYVAEKGKLPAGIEVNDQRGESIRVTVDEDR